MTKVLGAGLPLLAAHRDLVRGAIVADYVRMIDRKILGAVLKLRHRIAAGFHDLGYKPIRLNYGPFRVVDESSLVGVPRLCEAIACC